ncbi:MAG: two-component regulator propeller domain-containing protein, partial [Bacteroidales bacterium]|nr:two-component regulator propeller domain-containing protein [Bacteroidales bacterium]
MRTIAGILILINLACFGQLDNYYLKSYSVSDGLPNNHVRWITQDRDGFLWLATWDGLARFNGVEFKTYRHDPNDSNSVAFFEIVKIAVDSNNQVWVFAGGRLCRYDRLHDHFIRYESSHFPEASPEGAPLGFFDIMVDPFGRLLVVYGNNYYNYDAEHDRFKKVVRCDSSEMHFIPSLAAFDNLKNFWYQWLDRPDSKYAQLYKCSYDPEKGITVTDSFACLLDNISNRFSNATLRADYFTNDSGRTYLA